MSHIVTGFREAILTIPWSEKDIVRVQRLGSRRFNINAPRAIVVQMASLWDKLTLLCFGRDMLRSRGIELPESLPAGRRNPFETSRNNGFMLSTRTTHCGSRRTAPTSSQAVSPVTIETRSGGGNNSKKSQKWSKYHRAEVSGRQSYSQYQLEPPMRGQSQQMLKDCYKR